MNDQKLTFKEESFKIIGCCMEVHKALGKGFNEIVYKEALEIEFKRRNLFYSKEKKFQIMYKEALLSRYYIADFVIFDKIILEIKAIEALTNSEIKQTLNYLAVSNLRLGILVNFGSDTLTYKRIIL